MSLAFWAARGNDQAKNYWATKGLAYRGLLADALSPLAPFRTVLEVGCHSGPNLWALRQRWPKAVLVGVDPSPHTVMYGAAMCEMERVPGIDFYQGHAPDCLLEFSNIDVMVSCYALAYLNPSQLSLTLERMCDQASCGLVICEPMPLNGRASAEVIDRTHKVQSWRHPYAKLLGKLLPTATITSRRFPGPDALDGIVIVRKANK